MGAILYAIEVPPYGGDTCFANQALAYDTLSDGHEADARRAARGPYRPPRRRAAVAGRNAYRSTKVREDDAWRETISLHPVVRTHPETGRKMLFVNAAYTVGFEGMTEGGSRAAARLPAGARPPPGIHLPLPLGKRLGRVLGQPLGQASRGPRCRSVPPADAAGSDLPATCRRGRCDMTADESARSTTNSRAARRADRRRSRPDRQRRQHGRAALSRLAGSELGRLLFHARRRTGARPVPGQAGLRAHSLGQGRLRHRGGARRSGRRAGRARISRPHRLRPGLALRAGRAARRGPARSPASSISTARAPAASTTRTATAASGLVEILLTGR